MTERRALTYCEIDIRVCSLVYGQGACRAQLGYPGGGEPNAVQFGGSSYLTRGAGLTGAADSKLLTVSGWIRPAASDVRYTLVRGTTTLGGTTSRWQVERLDDNRIQILARSADGSDVLDIRSSAGSVPGDRWTHFMASVDLSDAQKCHLLIGGASDLDVVAFADAEIDFTNADAAVGAYPNGTVPIEGDLAELWFAPGVYLDLGDPEERAKFITPDRRPVDLGATGDAPTGSAPLIYLGGVAETWHINLGSGGDFTRTGPALEAAGFATGDLKCFNSLGTCQDRASFDPAPVTMRYAKATDYRPIGIEAIPSLIDVDYQPAVIAPGKDLGTRAQITFTFRTHPHSDTGPGHDPYRPERTYDAYDQGDYWSKFRARQPYLRGAPIRWIVGFLGEDIADMETRHFFVEGVNGPTPDGIFTVTASDPLRALYGTNANAPAPNTGRLLAGIDDNDGSATLTPTGIGDEEYPDAGHLALGGSEIVAFERSGDTLTLTGRGALGTEAVAHEADERVQTVLVYEPQDAADIMYDLVVNRAGQPPEWCDLEAWKTETAQFLGRLYGTVVPEPSSVNALASELIRQAGLTFWWDELAQQYRLQVLRPIATDAIVYSPSVIVENSFAPEDQPEERISQVWIKFARANPLKGDQHDNYRGFDAFLPEPGTPGDDGDVGEASIEHISSRWIALGAQATARRCAELLVARYLRPPRLFRFRLFRGAQDMPGVGQGCLIGHRVLQDASGAPDREPAQVISVRPGETGFDVTALEMRFAEGISQSGVGQHDLVLTGLQNWNINARQLHDGVYPPAGPADRVNIYVMADAEVGSTSVGAPAFDVGNWPTSVQSGTRTNGSPTITGLADTSQFEAGMFVRGTGIPDHAKIASVDSSSQITLDADATSDGTSNVTVHLIRIAVYMRGLIAGPGGPGGVGGDGDGDKPGGNGQMGGTALYARYPFDLVLTDGNPRLWGGGGGGAGIGTRHYNDHKGGGGGGGAGKAPGAGGVGPGNGQEGSAGTLTAGGQGGQPWTHTGQIWLGPGFSHSYRAGPGGGPGQPGGSPNYTLDTANGSPGAAGRAIDGASYVKKTGSGDIRGPQVN